MNLGNRRFVSGKSIFARRDNKAVARVVNNQEPFAAIMSCSDSRVPNEIVFDEGIGDLFISRTAGRVPGEASYRTIEFGTAVLSSKLIVVLGHSECGAVKAAMGEPENVPGAISYLISSIREGIEGYDTGGPGDRTGEAVKRNVVHQVNPLRKRQPVLSRAYRDKKVIILGEVDDLATGKVTYIPETLARAPVDPAIFNVNQVLPGTLVRPAGVAGPCRPGGVATLSAGRGSRRRGWNRIALWRTSCAPARVLEINKKAPEENLESLNLWWTV